MLVMDLRSCFDIPVNAERMNLTDLPNIETTKNNMQESKYLGRVKSKQTTTEYYCPVCKTKLDFEKIKLSIANPVIADKAVCDSCGLTILKCYPDCYIWK